MSMCSMFQHGRVKLTMSEDTLEGRSLENNKKGAFNVDVVCSEIKL